MIRITVLGLAAAAALLTVALAPTSASVTNYAADNKSHYSKGSISKNCLDHQGTCTLVVM